MTTTNIPTGDTATITTESTTCGAERVHVDHATLKRMGHWTTANTFQVRVRKGNVVLDLRSPQIAGQIDLDLDLRRSTLVLLVPDDAAIDQWELRFDRGGRVHDQQPSAAARCVRLHGAAADSQIRVRRGGVAQVTAMLSREYLADLRRARRDGTVPTVDDPARDQA